MANILFITPFLSGKGGTETVLRSVLEYAPKGCRLLVLGGTDDGKWISELPQNLKVSVGPSNKVLQLLYLAYFLLVNSFDKIICMSTTIIKVTSIFRKIMNKKYEIFSWIHFSITQESSVDENSLLLADKFLAISSGIKNELLALGVSAERVFLIWNPVSQKKKTIGPSHSKKTVIAYIGRVTFEGQKNIRELLLAIKMVPKNTLVVNIYGTGDSELCKRFIQDNDITQHFVWHGWVENPWNQIKTMDAVVMSSKYEGLPMTLLESLSYGVPVISSDCPTGPSDIVNDKNGFLYAVGDTKELSKQIEKIKAQKFNRVFIKESIGRFYVSNFNQKFWNTLLSE